MYSSTKENKNAGEQKKISLIKKLGIVFSIMSVIAGILTGIMTWANLGFSDTFLSIWGVSFITTIVFLLPILGILMALFSKLVKRAFPKFSALRQNMIIGLLLSIVMQSIMAVITAANAVGFDNFALYGAAWLDAFITAIPVGLVLALILTTVIKPRLEAYLKT